MFGGEIIMSIFDGDRNPINIPFPTLGGETFWDCLDIQGGYELQQHKITKHCRILDSNNVRVAWGEEGPMRAKLQELNYGKNMVCAKYGDVIGVHRIGGVYDHYGIYESDNCVYEYAAKNGDFGKADIHVTTLRKFIGNSNNYFVLTFPEEHGKPGKITLHPSFVSAGATAVGGIGTAGVNVLRIPGRVLTLVIDELEKLKKSEDYHLYSPDETIQRAKSKLGEKKYNLVANNCEHYAIWCKTGLHESHQVESLLHAVRHITGV